MGKLCLVVAAASLCIATAPSSLAASGGSSTTSSSMVRVPSSSSGGSSLSSLRLSGRLRVHVDRLAVLRCGFGFVPSWDIVEGTFSCGMVLDRARPAGVGSHGVGCTIEGVGSVAEKANPSHMDVADDKGRIGLYTKLCDFTLLFMILQAELRLNKDH